MNATVATTTVYLFADYTRPFEGDDWQIEEFFIPEDGDTNADIERLYDENVKRLLDGPPSRSTWFVLVAIEVPVFDSADPYEDTYLWFEDNIVPAEAAPFDFSAHRLIKSFVWEI